MLQKYRSKPVVTFCLHALNDRRHRGTDTGGNIAGNLEVGHFLSCILDIPGGYPWYGVVFDAVR